MDVAFQELFNVDSWDDLDSSGQWNMGRRGTGQDRRSVVFFYDVITKSILSPTFRILSPIFTAHLLRSASVGFVLHPTSSSSQSFSSKTMLVARLYPARLSLAPAIRLRLSTVRCYSASPVPRKTKVWDSVDEAVKDVKSGDILLCGGELELSHSNFKKIGIYVHVFIIQDLD